MKRLISKAGYLFLVSLLIVGLFSGQALAQGPTLSVTFEDGTQSLGIGTQAGNSGRYRFEGSFSSTEVLSAVVTLNGQAQEYRLGGGNEYKITGNTQVSNPSDGVIYNWWFIYNHRTKVITAHNGSGTSDNNMPHELLVLTTTGGSVNSDDADGFYVEGTIVEVIATPDTGYVFDSWTWTVGGEDHSSNDAIFNFTMPGENVTLTANFAEVETYNLSLTADPTDGGTVSGEGEYPAGEMVPVTATANPGYRFVNWTEEVVSRSADVTTRISDILSTDASFEYEMPEEDITLVATFEEVETYLLTLQANPEAGGTLTGGGHYPSGEMVTVTATANQGWNFVSWTIQVEATPSMAGIVIEPPLSTEPSFVYTMPEENVTLTANFEEAETFNLTLVASPSAGGVVSGGGPFVPGTSVPVTATANAGYRFVNWTWSEGGQSGTANFNYSMPENDITLTANFVAVQTPTYSYTLTLEASPEGGGGVAGGGIYFAGDSVQITAVAKSGYNFVNWTDASGNKISGDAKFTYTMPSGSRTLTANFEEKTYTLTLKSAPENGGDFTGAGVYKAGTKVPVTATAKDGYKFVNWTDAEGEEVSGKAKFTYTMQEMDSTLTANFKVVDPAATLPLTGTNVFWLIPFGLALLAAGALSLRRAVLS